MRTIATRKHRPAGNICVLFREFYDLFLQPTARGLELRAGRALACNFAFRSPALSTASRYFTAYEPNRFVKFVWEEL